MLLQVAPCAAHLATDAALKDFCLVLVPLKVLAVEQRVTKALPTSQAVVDQVLPTFSMQLTVLQQLQFVGTHVVALIAGKGLVLGVDLGAPQVLGVTLEVLGEDSWVREALVTVLTYVGESHLVVLVIMTLQGLPLHKTFQALATFKGMFGRVVCQMVLT